MKTCPDCGTTLNKLTGRDGHVAVPCAEFVNRGATGRIVLVAQLQVIHTCPKCDHCE